MAWEEIPGHIGGGGGMFMPIGDDEVSIVQTTVRNSKILRINIPRKLIPQEIVQVTLKIDKEKKRIGFFKVVNPENARKLNPYGKKNRLVYCSMPKVVRELGFEKGRYKATTKKDIEGLFFLVRSSDLVAKFPTAEELAAKQTEKMKANA